MAVKRAIDLAVAALGLSVLSPLLLAIALTVILCSGRPVIYAATRVGRGGRTFRLYKFRTMAIAQQATGSRPITVAGDDRVLPEGRLLRKWKLDELPQLVNVLKGDMSLVGPRPEDPHYVAMYDAEQRRLLELRPGITSKASLAFSREEELLPADDWEAVYVKEVLPKKLAMEIAYAKNWSLRADLRVLLATVKTVLLGNEDRAGSGTRTSDSET
ncbi:MAG: sugar transferase [Thermoleophilia bacterium]|nr:sugar transferase [Thermoleophilia bacterium]